MSLDSLEFYNKAGIPLRRLGKDGPLVSALGLGCMGMSEFYGDADQNESIQVLNRAIDIGITFWDTADMYGIGDNEQLLGKVLSTRRKEVFLCTKFGNVRDKNDSTKKGICGTREYVLECCENSLKRLGVDFIDLYYQHRVDQSTPIEVTVGAMSELVKAGKVKYLGLSECSASTLRRAFAVHPIAAVQMEYSPWTLEIEENGLLEAARELGVAIVPYSPLGRGFLTGQYKSLNDFAENDWRRHNPRFQGENFEKNLDLVMKFEQLAKEKNATTSQLVLAWVMAQGNDIIPIPGTKRLKYLVENIGSFDVTINEEDEKKIREILNGFKVSGTRYPEAFMFACNV